MSELSDRGLFWLKVDINNTFGNDKLTFDKQLEWFDEISYEDDGTNFERIIELADSPYEYRNAIKAYRNYQEELQINHMIYVDASNQALQMYAVLTGDLNTAKMCNLSGEDKRYDAYQLVADMMNEITKTSLFTRDLCKKPVMTTLYGKVGAGMVILEKLGITEEELAERAGITYKEGWLNEAFKEAMFKVAPMAMQCMDRLQMLNDEDIDTYYWTMPDGFKVKYDVKQTIEYEGKRTSKNGIDFTFQTQTEIYGGHKYNAGMAPNIIHSIDGYICRQVIRKMEDKFITTIHDAYGCHPNDVDYLINLYKDELIHILESNLLDDIMKQIANGKHYLKQEKINTLKPQHIINSKYALA